MPSDTGLSLSNLLLKGPSRLISLAVAHRNVDLSRQSRVDTKESQPPDSAGRHPLGIAHNEERRL